jgi:hypothetical protein
MPVCITTMTPDIPNQRTLLDELDQRQDEVLARLDELNLRIESVLQEHSPTSHAASKAAGGDSAL